MKKIFIVVLCVALLVVSASMTWAEEDEYVSEILSPRAFATVYNEALYIAKEEILAERYDEETLDTLIKQLSLSYSEIAGSIAYYDNQDWTAELAAFYDNGREIDVDDYADILLFSISADYDQDKRHYVSDIALSIALNYFDQQMEITEITEYLMAAYKDSSMGMLKLDGFYLTVSVKDSSYEYAIINPLL